MKRLTSILFSLLFVCAFLCGCSAKPQNSQHELQSVLDAQLEQELSSQASSALPPPPQESIPPPETSPPEMPAGNTNGYGHDGHRQEHLQEEVLSYQEMKIEDGRVLRLEAMGTRLDSYFYGVKEIRVYEQTKLLQVISVRTALAAEGEEGEYTQCWSPDDVMSLQDMNFDGITDIGLFGMVCNNEIPYYYWLWDTEEGEFRYSYSLQGASVNWETRQIVCHYKLGDGVYHTDYYEYDSKNSLQLVQRDVHTQNMH